MVVSAYGVCGTGTELRIVSIHHTKGTSTTIISSDSCLNKKSSELLSIITRQSHCNQTMTYYYQMVFGQDYVA